MTIHLVINGKLRSVITLNDIQDMIRNPLTKTEQNDIEIGDITIEQSKIEENKFFIGHVSRVNKNTGTLRHSSYYVLDLRTKTTKLTKYKESTSELSSILRIL